MSPISGRSILGAALVVAVAGAIAAGLVVVGSPGRARLERMDDRRVADLGQIASAIDAWWNTNRRMPASLDEAATGGRGSVPRDPATGDPYAYRAIDDMHYEICATFDRASDVPPAMNARPFAGHGPGRQCFAIQVRDGGRARPGRQSGRGGDGEHAAFARVQLLEKRAPPRQVL